MYAVPGGLIGVGMKVDPYITRSDSLVGQIIGYPDHMPEVVSEIEVKFYLLKRLLGVQAKKKASDENQSADVSKVKTLAVDEVLMINVGSQSLAGKILSLPKKDKVRVEFMKPVCANIGDKIALSRRVENNFRLIGWGEIKKCFSKTQRA